MIIDSNLRFANALAITTSKASTIVDGKYLKDWGRGRPVYLNIYLNTIFTSAANGLTIQLIASSGADPGSTDVIHTVMDARLASAMQTTGLLVRWALPQDIPYERVGLWLLATTALAVGKIDAFLSLGQDSDVVTTT
jgi:hypothetical protein